MVGDAGVGMTSMLAGYEVGMILVLAKFKT